MKRKEDNGEEKCSGIRKREESCELQISSLGTLEKVWIWENADKCNDGHVEFEGCGTYRRK